MNTELLVKIEKPYLKKIDKFNVGDTIEVYNIVREGKKSRIQIFKGIVISMKGSGTRKMFMVRKISYGIGVEKIFPLYSPNIEKIVIVKRGNVRRAKLYYMRKRIGKKALKITDGEIQEGTQFAEYGDYIPADEPTEIEKAAVDQTEESEVVAEVSDEQEKDINAEDVDENEVNKKKDGEIEEEKEVKEVKKEEKINDEKKEKESKTNKDGK